MAQSFWKEKKMNLIPKEYFDPEAPIDEPMRFHHPGCSDGKDPCLIVTRVADGWTYICHRCGASGKKPIRGHDASTVRKWIRSLHSNKKKHQKKKNITLPKDFTLEIPPHGLVWLYKYDLRDSEIRRFGIGYSPLMDRVILPVYSDRGKLLYFSGRYLKDAKKDKVPKYMTVKDSTRKRVYFFRLDYPHDQQIVLVEDQLSAIKVGRVTNACALLGSYVDQELIKRCCNRFGRVYLWLDNDMAGKIIQTSKRFRDMGKPVFPVVSKHDPKVYREEEINEYVKRD
jgi:hypothetical protein